MTLACDRQKSDDRRRALEEYYTANVLAAEFKYYTANVLAAEFICTHYKDCRSSHAATFYEGQVHHVGRLYDFLFDGVPLRIVIVGQEYGHEPPQVNSEAGTK